MNDKEFDPVVGLALHEGSHVKLTNFTTLKLLMENNEFPSSMLTFKNSFLVEEGSEFKYHHDDIIGEIFPHWFLRRQNILTCNFYFSDAKNYEGGDLVFTCGKTFHPSMGDIIIFPSNWIFYHEVQKITKGKRYSGTVWLYYGSSKRMPNAKSKDW